MPFCGGEKWGTHPLRRGELSVRGTSAGILKQGTTYQDDLAVNYGILNRAPESLPPISMAESDKNEDMMEDRSTLRNKMKKKGKSKVGKHKSKKVRKQEGNEQWPEIKHPLHLKERRTLR